MKNQTTNKDIKGVVISIIVAVVVATAMLIGTNMSSQAAGTADKFVVRKSDLTLTDNKIVVDLGPDRKFDKNDWEATNWTVRLGLEEYTKTAYFTAYTPKQVRKFRTDIHYDIEGVYHRFVRNSQSCTIPEGQTQAIINYFEPIHYNGVQWQDNKGRAHRMQTGTTISTKNKPSWVNGSCVLLKVKKALRFAKDGTIYATYYIRHPD